jgi:TIR domain
MAEAADFFVSYTSADQAWAEWIAWQLEAEGYQVVVQAWNFRPGAEGGGGAERDRHQQGQRRHHAAQQQPEDDRDDHRREGNTTLMSRLTVGIDIRVGLHTGR